MRARRPWLLKEHPNFALIFIATALFHLTCCLILWLQPESMLTPALERTLEVAPTEWWGATHMVVFLMMAIGLFLPTFTLARAGLAIGLAVMVTRGMLLLVAWVFDNQPTGLGVPVWMLVSILHLSQVLEPPTNPATSRH